jgi:hypothetical protein
VKARNGIPIKPIKTILLDFVNSKDPDQAWDSFQRDIGKAHGLEKPDGKTLRDEIRRLRKLFREVNNTDDLVKSKSIHDYLAQYYVIPPPLRVLPDGTIGEAPIFADKDRRQRRSKRFPKTTLPASKPPTISIGGQGQNQVLLDAC